MTGSSKKPAATVAATADVSDMLARRMDVAWVVFMVVLPMGDRFGRTMQARRPSAHR